MPREIDERWLEEAIERYQQLDERIEKFNASVQSMDVSVRSPDGHVQLTANGSGAISRVQLSDDALDGRTAQDLAKLITETCAAVPDAVYQARLRLHEQAFRDYPPLRRN